MSKATRLSEAVNAKGLAGPFLLVRVHHGDSGVRGFPLPNPPHKGGGCSVESAGTSEALPIRQPAPSPLWGGLGRGWPHTQADRVSPAMISAIYVLIFTEQEGQTCRPAGLPLQRSNLRSR